MSIDEIKRWLKAARKRLWEAKREKDALPPNHPDREHLAGVVKHREEVRDKLLAKLKRALQGKDDIQLSYGSPHWGGCEDIIQLEVIPVAEAWNIAVTSGKRTETYGNPGSDHHTSQTNASARDFATANNHAFADDIGRALGIGLVSDYTAYYITRQGVRFRVQIIAATHGTGPHTHVGIRRA